MKINYIYKYIDLIGYMYLQKSQNKKLRKHYFQNKNNNEIAYFVLYILYKMDHISDLVVLNELMKNQLAWQKLNYLQVIQIFSVNNIKEMRK